MMENNKWKCEQFYGRSPFCPSEEFALFKISGTNLTAAADLKKYFVMARKKVFPGGRITISKDIKEITGPV